MKTPLLLVLLVLPVMAQEFRTVGGKQIDLSPLLAWQQNKEGERPLAHWKEVRITQCLGKIGTHTKCAAVIEGQAKTVLISNIKPETVARIAKVDALLAYTSKEAERLKREADRIERLDAVTPTGASGNANYVNAVMAQREQVNLAAVNLKRAQEALEAKQDETLKLLEEIKQDSDFAMFTGQKYAGLEVWDCGLRKR